MPRARFRRARFCPMSHIDKTNDNYYPGALFYFLLSLLDRFPLSPPPTFWSFVTTCMDILCPRSSSLSLLQLISYLCFSKIHRPQSSQKIFTRRQREVLCLLPKPFNVHSGLTQRFAMNAGGCWGLIRHFPIFLFFFCFSTCVLATYLVYYHYFFHVFLHTCAPDFFAFFTFRQIFLSGIFTHYAQGKQIHAHGYQLSATVRGHFDAPSIPPIHTRFFCPVKETPELSKFWHRFPTSHYSFFIVTVSICSSSVVVVCMFDVPVCSLVRLPRDAFVLFVCYASVHFCSFELRIFSSPPCPSVFIIFFCLSITILLPPSLWVCIYQAIQFTINNQQFSIKTFRMWFSLHGVVWIIRDMYWLPSRRFCSRKDLKRTRRISAIVYWVTEFVSVEYFTEVVKSFESLQWLGTGCDV